MPKYGDGEVGLAHVLFSSISSRSMSGLGICTKACLMKEKKGEGQEFVARLIFRRVELLTLSGMVVGQLLELPNCRSRLEVLGAISEV